MPPDFQPRRQLSEPEKKAIKLKVMQSLPPGLDEVQFKRRFEPAMQQALAEAEYTQPQPEGSALGRAASSFGQMVNPITAVKNVVGAVAHPIETATNIYTASADQATKAKEAYQQGRYLEAGAHAAGTVPLVGPLVAGIGEQGARGDVAGMVGSTLGVLAPVAAGEVVKFRNRPNMAGADLLERKATQQVADKVLSPGNPRYKGRAQAIAPEMLARKMTGDRFDLQQAASEGMMDAVERIDDAVNVQKRLPGGGQIPIQEVIAGYKQAISRLKDSKGIPLSDEAGRRIGRLEARVLEMKARGGKTGMIDWDDLKDVRDENYRLANNSRAYERQGTATQQMSDEGYAAMQAGSSIKDVMARRSPSTAAANADYTFFKTLDDILDPAEGRPKSTALPAGVTGGAKVSGVVAGLALNSKAAAFIMGNVVPWVREQMASPRWQLADANRKMALAEAMRSGDIGRMKAAMVNFGVGLPAVTSPTGPQQTTPGGLSIQGLEVPATR